MVTTTWLGDLAGQSLGDFDTSDELDRDLSALAFDARTDDDESWQLFRMLAWKVERFVRRFRSWDLAPFDIEDVAQESYLVYQDTLRRWRPRYIDGRPRGYLYYFLKVFPLWLGNAVRGWRRPARPPVVKHAHRESHATADTGGAVIDDFCRHLAPQEATLLQLRLSKGLSVPRAAERMGLARRTAYRRWRRILDLGRVYLREAG